MMFFYLYLYIIKEKYFFYKNRYNLDIYDPFYYMDLTPDEYYKKILKELNV